jgi:hypothetical protein
MAGGNSKSKSPFPWLPMGIGAFGVLAGQGMMPDFNMEDPAKYFKDLVISDAEISKELGAVQQRAGGPASKAIGDIKSMTAANRMPTGAALSGIAGVQGEVAKGVAGALPGMKSAQKQSMAQYLGMKNQYEASKMEYGMGKGDRALGGLGVLGQVAMLWQAGLL